MFSETCNLSIADIHAVRLSAVYDDTTQTKGSVFCVWSAGLLRLFLKIFLRGVSSLYGGEEDGVVLLWWKGRLVTYEIGREGIEELCCAAGEVCLEGC